MARFSVCGSRRRAERRAIHYLNHEEKMRGLDPRISLLSLSSCGRGEPLIRLDAEGISPPSPARGEGLTHLQIHNSETLGQALCPPGEGVVGGWPSWVAYSK